MRVGTKIASLVFLIAPFVASPAVADAPACAAPSGVCPASPYDFDGDGVRDSAFGTPNSAIGGGFCVINTSAGRQNFRRPDVQVPSSPGLGVSVTGLDFNADGFADLIVGDP